MVKVKPANDPGIISVEDILGTTVTGTNKADKHGTDPVRQPVQRSKTMVRAGRANKGG
jgi:hypothetical protein